MINKNLRHKFPDTTDWMSTAEEATVIDVVDVIATTLGFIGVRQNLSFR